MFSTFRGGIHPPEKKELTRDCEFSNLSVPTRCYIPMLQHEGTPAKPVVKAGDNVMEGQLIGEASGPMSANVHSSIPGKVVAVKDVLTVYQMQPAVIVEMEGSFPSSAIPKVKADWHTMLKEEIQNRIREAGIVGLGGAAIPTSMKVSPSSDRKIDILLVNGAECEPYLTADEMLLRTYPNEIIEGIQITLKALGISMAVAGIDENKKKAFTAFSDAKESLSIEESISVKKVKTKYPQGEEKLFISSLIKKMVPSNGFPMDIGVVVMNIGTIYSIREAVLYKKNLFERFITVSGDMIVKPGNYKVRLGTTVADIVEDCGGLKGEPEKIIIGGPMCGICISSMDVPVVKGTTGILFLSEKEVSIDDYGTCIRCGRCVSACPVRLLPCETGNAMELGRIDRVQELSVCDCILCGSCSFVCPAKRPLSRFMELAQDAFKKRMH